MSNGPLQDEFVNASLRYIRTQNKLITYKIRSAVISTNTAIASIAIAQLEMIQGNNETATTKLQEALDFLSQSSASFREIDQIYDDQDEDHANG